MKLTEFLIETLYRFEGSERFFNCSLKTAQGRQNGKTKTSKSSQGYGAVAILRRCNRDKHSGLLLPSTAKAEVLGRRSKQARSSEEERRVDARALIADEGRDKLRKASGSRK